MTRLFIVLEKVKSKVFIGKLCHWLRTARFARYRPRLPLLGPLRPWEHIGVAGRLWCSLLSSVMNRLYCASTRRCT